MTLEMPDAETPAEAPAQEDKKARKKRLQAEAWKRWWVSPKGEAWRDARRKTPKVAK